MSPMSPDVSECSPVTLGSRGRANLRRHQLKPRCLALARMIHKNVGRRRRAEMARIVGALSFSRTTPAPTWPNRYVARPAQLGTLPAMESIDIDRRKFAPATACGQGEYPTGESFPSESIRQRAHYRRDPEAIASGERPWQRQYPASVRNHQRELPRELPRASRPALPFNPTSAVVRKLLSTSRLKGWAHREVSVCILFPFVADLAVSMLKVSPSLCSTNFDDDSHLTSTVVCICLSFKAETFSNAQPYFDLLCPDPNLRYPLTTRCD
jgi:hypothetical protein